MLQLTINLARAKTNGKRIASRLKINLVDRLGGQQEEESHALAGLFAVERFLLSERPIHQLPTVYWILEGVLGSRAITEGEGLLNLLE